MASAEAAEAINGEFAWSFARVAASFGQANRSYENGKIIANIKRNALQYHSDVHHEYSKQTSIRHNETMSNSIEDIIKSSTIEQLQALISRAEDEIEYKKVDEIETTRNEWIAKASQLGMNPEDILQYTGRKRKSTGKPKYRNPANPEQTWTGHGKKPGWLKQAVENGANQESFRIPE
ncbi:MAG: H-NS histone family protein [Candidatus Competibacter denitrificans]